MTIRQENDNTGRSRMKSRPRRCRREDEIGIRGSYDREIGDNIKEEKYKEQRKFLSCYFHTSTPLKTFMSKAILGHKGLQHITLSRQNSKLQTVLPEA